MYIAKSKKAYIISEELLKLCMIHICIGLFGNEYVTKIRIYLCQMKLLPEE